MTDEEVLKVRIDELMEKLDCYLRDYNRLIRLGYRKLVLDAEIELIQLELKRQSALV